MLARTYDTKASQLIEMLKNAIDKHGDQVVCGYNFGDGNAYVINSIEYTPKPPTNDSKVSYFILTQH